MDSIEFETERLLETAVEYVEEDGENGINGLFVNALLHGSTSASANLNQLTNAVPLSNMDKNCCPAPSQSGMAGEFDQALSHNIGFEHDSCKRQGQQQQFVRGGTGLNFENIRVPMDRNVSGNPGSYNFRVSEDGDAGSEVLSKNTPHVYCEFLNKFFFNIEVPCPITFKVDSPTMLCNPCVRVTTIFKEVKHRNEVIFSCPDHNSSEHRHRIFDVLCHSKDRVTYYQRPGGHISAIVELSSDSMVNGTFSLTFFFHCLNSCRAGIRNRHTTLLFELMASSSQEESLNVVGSCCSDVQVCTCPGRAMSLQKTKKQLPKKERENHEEKYVEDSRVTIKKLDSCHVSVELPHEKAEILREFVSKYPGLELVPSVKSE